jgi:RNA polymerase sigma-70 factor (ECF subfamily)
MTDLVDRARDGDAAAFERLYRDHVGRVHAICLRMCADPARAEEYSQDAFVQAWQKLPSFRGDGGFSSWLYRLTVNVVLQGVRADSRRRWHLVGDDTSQFGASRAEAPAGLARDLDRAIAELPPGARTAFVLHDVEGYEYTEIAEMTGKAVGTMKAQAHRARKLLCEKLASWRTVRDEGV